MNIKKILAILLISLAIILISIFFLYFSQNYLTAKVVEDVTTKYSYTKAICNSTNYCEDFEIQCDGKQVVSITPTGSAIQHAQNWQDPRNKTDKLC